MKFTLSWLREHLDTDATLDQITDGLNDFSLALSRSGMGSKLGKMARCTVVGHMIKKSYLGENAAPLLGVKRFFEV